MWCERYLASVKDRIPFVFQQAENERMDTMMAGLIKQNPPPDKATDNLAWAAHMNALRHSAEETILAELIFE